MAAQRAGVHSERRRGHPAGKTAGDGCRGAAGGGAARPGRSRGGGGVTAGWSGARRGCFRYQLVWSVGSRNGEAEGSRTSNSYGEEEQKKKEREREEWLRIGGGVSRERGRRERGWA